MAHVGPSHTDLVPFTKSTGGPAAKGLMSIAVSS